MDNKALQNFADNYRIEDFDKIKFDWNGLHGDKFNDTNYKFRIELCELLVPQLGSAKIELIRDLYIELARSSKETWGIYNKFHLFGQQLLIRGGVDHLKYYMQGASFSSDAYLQSGQIEISKDLAQLLLESIENSIKTTSDEKEKKGAELFKKRFEFLLNK